MNCWRFDARIFDACRDVPRSARGEFELPGGGGARDPRAASRFKAIPRARTGPRSLAPRRRRRRRAAAGGTWRRGHDGRRSGGSARSTAASIPRRRTRRRRCSTSSSGRFAIATGARPGTRGGCRDGSKSSASTPTTRAAARSSAPCRADSRSPRARAPTAASACSTRGAATASILQPPDGAAAFTGWRHYVDVVARRLAANFPGAPLGADIVFASDLPRASGMSSSSALVVAIVRGARPCRRHRRAAGVAREHPRHARRRRATSPASRTG